MSGTLWGLGLFGLVVVMLIFHGIALGRSREREKSQDETIKAMQKRNELRDSDRGDPHDRLREQSDT